jgi:anthranilate synthase component 2
MKVLIIDNYDSFTYNLVHLVQSILNKKVDVIRNDKLDLEAIDQYDKIILSPGPGIPDEAGMLKEIIRKYASTKSILGVCLGLQAIAEVFGAQLINLSEVYHGLATEIQIIKEDRLFKNASKYFLGGRYHSWIVSKENFPDCLEITAIDSENNIMALSHKTYNVKAVQFHPESVLTENGDQIIRNWLFQNEENSINLPSNSSTQFDIYNLKSNLLFC